jgi:hypothetical protein
MMLEVILLPIEANWPSMTFEVNPLLSALILDATQRILIFRLCKALIDLVRQTKFETK